MSEEPQLGQVLAPWVDTQVHELVVGLADLSAPQNVHMARVRCRRLRGVLGACARVLPKHEAATHREIRLELRWLGRELSALRDHDVVTELARESDDSAAPAWLAALELERPALLERAQQVVASERTARLLDRLETLRDGQAWAEASVPAGPALERVLRKEFRRVMRRAEAEAAYRERTGDAGAVALSEPLHLVRKAAKRLRYAAEVTGPLVPGAAELAVAAETVQETLGSQQDAVMLAQWVATHPTR